MKKAQDKSILARLKPLWDQGKNLSNVDIKIAYCIQNYVITSIFSAFKANSSALNEGEKKDFEGMIKELAIVKKQIEQPYTAEEYDNFLQNMFANVDDEDRHGEVTMKTSASFKLVSELIDVFAQWGAIPEEWNKKKKYCKFKALDIFKSLKAGATPKRGGPKEEEDDIGKEINSLALEQKNENENKEVINDNSGINTIPSNNINTDVGNYNYTNVTPPQILNHNSESAKNVFVNKIVPEKGVDYSKKTYNNTNDNTIHINKPQTNNLNYNPDINTILPTTSIDLKKNSSMLALDFTPDIKLTKKLDFSLPVKYKSIDYFRLCDVIKKQIDVGMRELNGNKLDKTLAHAELVYYYLDNISR